MSLSIGTMRPLVMAKSLVLATSFVSMTFGTIIKIREATKVQGKGSLCN